MRSMKHNSIVNYFRTTNIVKDFVQGLLKTSIFNCYSGVFFVVNTVLFMMYFCLFTQSCSVIATEKWDCITDDFVTSITNNTYSWLQWLSNQRLLNEVKDSKRISYGAFGTQKLRSTRKFLKASLILPKQLIRHHAIRIQGQRLLFFILSCQSTHGFYMIWMKILTVKLLIPRCPSCHLIIFINNSSKYCFVVAYQLAAYQLA